MKSGSFPSTVFLFIIRFFPILQPLGSGYNETKVNDNISLSVKTIAGHSQEGHG